MSRGFEAFRVVDNADAQIVGRLGGKKAQARKELEKLYTEDSSTATCETA